MLFVRFSVNSLKNSQWNFKKRGLKFLTHWKPRTKKNWGCLSTQVWSRHFREAKKVCGFETIRNPIPRGDAAPVESSVALSNSGYFESLRKEFKVIFKPPWLLFQFELNNSGIVCVPIRLGCWVLFRACPSPTMNIFKKSTISSIINYLFFKGKGVWTFRKRSSKWAPDCSLHFPPVSVRTPPFSARRNDHLTLVHSAFAQCCLTEGRVGESGPASCSAQRPWCFRFPGLHVRTWQ